MAFLLLGNPFGTRIPIESVRKGLLGISCYWDRTDPFIIKTNVETFILKSKLSVFALEKLSENTDVMILVRFMFLKLYQSLQSRF